MFISRHEHYLWLKVHRRYFQYISLGQPVCFALIKDGGKTMKALILLVVVYLIQAYQMGPLIYLLLYRPTF